MAVLETFFERHAWKVFLGLGILIVLFGIGDMLEGGATYGGGEAAMFQRITGTTWEDLQATDPAAAKLIDHRVRAGGAQELVIGILGIAVSLTGFRRGERWAWDAMWVWPLWTALAILLLSRAATQPGPGTPVPLVSGSIILVISSSTLALSYRKFFARRRSERAQEE